MDFYGPLLEDSILSFDRAQLTAAGCSRCTFLTYFGAISLANFGSNPTFSNFRQGPDITDLAFDATWDNGLILKFIVIESIICTSSVNRLLADAEQKRTIQSANSQKPLKRSPTTGRWVAICSISDIQPLYDIGQTLPEHWYTDRYFTSIHIVAKNWHVSEPVDPKLFYQPLIDNHCIDDKTTITFGADFDFWRKEAILAVLKPGNQ